MFRDTEEALRRLEQALLAEEEPPEEEPEAVPDTEAPNSPEYRNFANHYKAYNTDTSDTDLDALSEAVRSPKKSGTAGLAVLVLLLLAAFFGLLAWWLVQYGGLL